MKEQSPEDAFLEDLYSRSELKMDNTNDRALDLILRSFNSMFWEGERPDLNLEKILELVDITRISDTEKITLLTSSIECNNPAVYRSEARKKFCKRVDSYFKKHRSKDRAGLMMGLM